MSTTNTFNSLFPDYKESYMHKPKLGSGDRFKHLKNMLSKKPGIKDPGALAAAIGRKKYGNKKMNELSHHKHK